MYLIINRMCLFCFNGITLACLKFNMIELVCGMLVAKRPSNNYLYKRCPMKIILVDDESAVKILFKQKFKKEIKDKLFDFEFVSSAEEALNTLNINAGNSDSILVMSDINMPGLSGLQLAQYMKENYPKIRVMIVTAYDDKANYKAAMERGVTDFFVKPIDFDQLRNKLLEISAQKVGPPT